MFFFGAVSYCTCRTVSRVSVSVVTKIVWFLLVQAVYHIALALYGSIRYGSGFQTGVRGRKGVCDGFPGGLQEDSKK